MVGVAFEIKSSGVYNQFEDVCDEVGGDLVSIHPGGVRGNFYLDPSDEGFDGLGRLQDTEKLGKGGRIPEMNSLEQASLGGYLPTSAGYGAGSESCVVEVIQDGFEQFLWRIHGWDVELAE